MSKKDRELARTAAILLGLDPNVLNEAQLGKLLVELRKKPAKR